MVKGSSGLVQWRHHIQIPYFEARTGRFQHAHSGRALSEERV